MNKCLVTKLKASTNNNNLFKVGELRLKTMNVATDGSTPFTIKGSVNLSTIENGNNLYVNNEYIHSIDINSQSNTTIKIYKDVTLSIVPVYNLTELYLDATVDFNGKFKFYDGLSSIHLRLTPTSIIELIHSKILPNSVELIGKVIADLTDITVGRIFSISYSGQKNTLLTGNIDTWANIENLTKLSIAYSDIKGNFSTLAKTNISNFGNGLVEASITGSIESFVNEKRKTMQVGSVSAQWLGSNNITFQGSRIRNTADNTISWTETTITYNNTTINA